MRVAAYNAEVRQDHQSKIVRKWFGLYAWFWFHTQFWLDPLDRRPYTFIFRDWIYPHMAWFLVLLFAWYAGMFVWLYWAPWAPAVLLVLSSWLAAHLVWGSPWVPNQQEEPQIEGW